MLTNKSYSLMHMIPLLTKTVYDEQLCHIFRMKSFFNKTTSKCRKCLDK